MTAAPLNTTHLERDAEALLVKRVRLLGGKAVKLAPTEAGLPDRLIMLPGGGLYLVEVKSNTGKLSPIQELWHAGAAKLGIQVYVVAGRDGVLKWLADRTEGYYIRSGGQP